MSDVTVKYPTIGYSAEKVELSSTVYIWRVFRHFKPCNFLGMPFGEDKELIKVVDTQKEAEEAIRRDAGPAGVVQTFNYDSKGRRDWTGLTY